MRLSDIPSSRRLIGLFHTLIVGTSVLSLAAWWLDYHLVFKVCAPLCTLLTLVVSFLVAPYSGGIGFTTFFNPALFFGIGLLIDRNPYPGLFIGGALYGFAYMVPIAVTDLQISRHARKIASIRSELGQLRQDLRESISKEDRLDDRVKIMSERFRTLRKAITEASAGVEALAVGADDFDELRDYYSCGLWQRDAMALTAEEFRGDESIEEFFSDRGLPELIGDVDAFLSTLADFANSRKD